MADELDFEACCLRALCFRRGRCTSFQCCYSAYSCVHAALCVYIEYGSSLIKVVYGLAVSLIATTRLSFVGATPLT